VLDSADSADYRAWRQTFMLNRLRLCLWIAIPFFLTIAAHSLFILFLNSQQLQQDVTKVYGDPTVAMRLHQTTLGSLVVTGVLLPFNWALQRTTWAKRSPEILFLSLSWSLNLTDHIVGSFFSIPVVPDALVFLAQATLVPVHWRLHLLSQLGPLLYYLLVYPLLGILQIGNRSLYDPYTIGTLADLLWISFISDLSVYLYERLQKTEFASRRELKVFVHSLTHDLRTPAMGTAIVLQNLLRKPETLITVDRSILECLLQGSERQLSLINTLLEAHIADAQNLCLNWTVFSLRSLVDAVLSDLELELIQHRVTVLNRIKAELPPIWGDQIQLWRVYTNLINNALKHNPHGICLTLDAHPEAGFLRCTVQDNGIGIDHGYHPHLFEQYVRGSRAHYIPGLGLGLYLCQQIVRAHGGQIGVNSQVNQGSTFWFTLPQATASASSVGTTRENLANERFGEL
jgi:signal transduction histidine kinase